MYRYGKMGANTKVIGEMIEPMVKEDLSIKMVTVTMENGLTTKLMDAEHMNTKIELSMLEIGRKTNNMGTVLKRGLT